MKWVKYLIFSLIGLLLLFLAFNNQSPKELLAQLKNVNYFWVILSMLFGFLAMVSRGIRWGVLLENMNYHPSNFNSICAVTIGYVTNLAIPRAGEVTRCTSLAQTEKIPIDKLLLETDTPYLAPVPLRGQDNRPNFIEHTAMKISNILDIDQKKLSEITISNSRRLLGRQS